MKDVTFEFIRDIYTEFGRVKHEFQDKTHEIAYRYDCLISYIDGAMYDSLPNEKIPAGRIMDLGEIIKISRKNPELRKELKEQIKPLTDRIESLAREFYTAYQRYVMTKESVERDSETWYLNDEELVEMTKMFEGMCMFYSFYFKRLLPIPTELHVDPEMGVIVKPRESNNGFLDKSLSFE